MRLTKLDEGVEPLLCFHFSIQSDKGQSLVEDGIRLLVVVENGWYWL